MSAVAETYAIVVGGQSLILGALLWQAHRSQRPAPVTPPAPHAVMSHRVNISRADRGLPLLPSMMPADEPQHDLSGPSVSRKEAADTLGCGERDVRGAVAMGVLEQFLDRSGARITTASLNKVLALRNGQSAAEVSG